jgi:hypothetical protein
MVDEQGPHLELVCTIRGQRGSAQAHITGRGATVNGETVMEYDSIVVTLGTRVFDLTRTPTGSAPAAGKGEHIVEAEFKEKP